MWQQENVKTTTCMHIDCEQSLFCSKIRAGRTAKPRARYSRGSNIAAPPAGFLEQKRDGSQSSMYSLPY